MTNDQCQMTNGKSSDLPNLYAQPLTLYPPTPNEVWGEM